MWGLLLDLAFLGACQDDPAAWVEKLGSETPVERERADRALKALGPAALPALRRAKESADPEVASRAAALIEVIELAESLPARLRKAAPDVVDRLASKRLDARSALRELADRERYPWVRHADLEAFLPRALAEVPGPLDRAAFLVELAQLRLGFVAPRLVPLFAVPKVDRMQIVHALGVLEAREAAPEIARLLRDPEADLVIESLRVLGRLRAEAALPDVVALFRDERIWIRQQAVQTASAIGGRAAARVLVPLLRDPQKEVRESAAEGLRNCALASEDLRAIVALLSEPAVEPRLLAAGLLVEAGARDFAPALAALLEDGDARVRDAAMDAMDRLWTPGLEKHVLPLLEDPAEEQQAAALRMLGRRRAFGAREAIRRRLDAPTPLVRAAALEAVQSLRDWESVPAVLARLKDPDPAVRLAAISAAVSHGVDAALPLLIELLEDPKSRSHALGALGTLGAKDAAGKVAAFFDDPDEATRDAARDALADLDPAAYRKRIVPSQLAQLDDPGRRADALGILGGAGVESAAPRFLEALDDEDDDVRRRAVFALVATDAVGRLPDLRLKLKSPKPGTREAALEVLRGWRRRELADEVRPLLRDPSLAVRWRAVEVLSGLEGPAALPSLEPLLKDPEGEIRAKVLRAVAAAGARDRSARIAEFLTDPHLEVRHTAAAALNELDSRDQAAALIRTLSAPDTNGHGLCPYAQAQDALRRWKDPAHVPPVLELLRHPSAWVRIVAWDTLHFLEAKVPTATLRELLEDPSSVLRMRACEELGKAAAKDANPALRPLLTDEDPQTRLAAASVLHAWGEAAAAAVLDKLAHHGQDHVRSGAALALGTTAALIALLDDPDPSAQQVGLKALAERGVMEALPRIEGMLAGPVRVAAADAWCRLRAGKRAVDLVDLLGHPSQAVRDAAEKALFTVPPAEAGPALEAALAKDPALAHRVSEYLLIEHGQIAAFVRLLDDPDPYRRLQRVANLSRLDPAAGRKALEAALRDVDPLVRSSMADGTTDGGALLLPLLRDPESEVRVAAAQALCLQGRREGAAVLIEEAARRTGVSLLALNAVRRPEEWSALSKVLSDNHETSPLADHLAAMAAKSGLVLELPAGPRSALLESFGWMGGGTPMTKTLVTVLKGKIQVGVVLEPGRLKVLASDDALAFWKDWIAR